VFSTRSQSVVPGSDNPSELMQVYLRDIAAGRTYLISSASAVGGGALGMAGVGDSDSDFARISGDGKWVVWGSGATNLPGNDPGPPQVFDVFVHEVDTATTTRIEALNGDAPNGNTIEPFVSSNGRYISFTSQATNLHSGLGPHPIPPPGCSTAVPNGAPSIYLYDKGKPDAFSAIPPSITWVSIGTDPNGCLESPQTQCRNSSVSANGCFVVFQSKSNNLTPESDGQSQQIYMRNMVTGTTKLVSHDAAGGPGNDVSRNAMISRDGRWVVFASAATDLVAVDSNGIGDVFVWERTTGVITRVSVYSDGSQILGAAGRNTFLYPHISGSGRFVFFTSAIDSFNNPGSPTTANTSEFYVHDRDYDHNGVLDEDTIQNGIRTIRLSDLPSSTSADLQSNGQSGGNCAATNDGKYVVFMGFASDFVDASDVGGVDTNGDAEPFDSGCCPEGAPCAPNPGETGRDIFRRTVW